MSRRSVMFSPGDQLKLMRKAPQTGADTVVFDLEDAVAPSRKDEARAAVRDVLSDPAFDPDAEVCVRVNPGDAAAADFDAILDADLRLDAVMVPKVSGLDDVVRVEERVTQAGFDLPLLTLVESAAGVLNAASIATASATDALVFGAEDLAADVGAVRTDEGTEVLYAREHVVLAASAADVDAVDTVYTDFSDPSGLREETEFALTLGYDGKMAIHPSQVDVINDAFTPETERVAWAKKVLAARDEAEAEGRGVFRVDDEMIDVPLIAQAERVRERAEAAGVW
ncbi:citrate lyase subunit beta / citryl-CoA lyase [Halogranum gelatinilyticum]|uniref:Citrate lyase subunit beta / citryl-CoA lyase n=1 Tax=Halogranum gelatinilyticum TaxID=660521 RepID=A0A1G9VK78_9EURY|nr:CoA ester lyase [Halogranum gelatinilyticum]SDM72500.1 citrate lyase subunit beta / citryl-CoA lyase [Halogranum gelatinilyticum]